MADDADSPATPGDLIRRELEARGWIQRDLAFVLGVPEQAVTMMTTGKRGVSADMARALAEVFGIAPETILRLQKMTEVGPELARSRKPDPGIARKARLTATYPIRDMVKRGWLRSDPATMEQQIAAFFGIASADERPQINYAAKKTDADADISPIQLAWLFRVRQIAVRQVVPKYSERALRDALPKLRSLLRDPREASAVPRILSDCGIRLVLVESLPAGKIDGVCFWIDQDSPVIGMSMRFDRIDNFWFVLRHEIEHVLKRHGGGRVLLDADLQIDDADGDGDISAEELEANNAATDFCVPSAKMDSFFARKSPFFSEVDVIGFAKLASVHPGLVAGQLRRRTKRYEHFTQFLVKIRAAVAATAVVDGWGETYPV